MARSIDEIIYSHFGDDARTYILLQDVSVKTIRKALTEAFEAGKEAPKTTKSGIKIIESFPLPIDEVLYKDRPMLERTKLERKVVASLIVFLEENGWRLNSVHDGEEEEFYKNMSAADRLVKAMDLIFNLDVSYLFFTNDHTFHRVDIVRGNSGWDAISNWRYAKNDADGFNALMQRFSDEFISQFED